VTCPDTRATVVILAKDSRSAKTRLQLPSDEARQVALHLAAATVRTALAAERVGDVLVVTGDPEIAVDALESGADVLAEPRPLGMNRAAELGRRQALALGRRAPLATMVADLPHLRPRDINCVLTEFDETGQPLFVADRMGAGTTFLVHGPDHRPGFGFGRGSAVMHRRLGYRASLTAPPGLRTDLDSREDLARLGGRLLRGRTGGLDTTDDHRVRTPVAGASPGR
jgi:2-phospho-L-lactate/phosphoenolpyruvate guanylyltransferase